ncbi:unnamed protein product [Periconia digitata]|uniref:Uncharacterized protein n=1 Tax=Periconia digitata TaxID=1303443 RepID=A0A9W4U7M4_9PLEO|nr:unnamed protein product [Periconia digitata]
MTNIHSVCTVSWGNRVHPHIRTMYSSDCFIVLLGSGRCEEYKHGTRRITFCPSCNKRVAIARRKRFPTGKDFFRLAPFQS